MTSTNSGKFEEEEDHTYKLVPYVNMCRCSGEEVEPLPVARSNNSTLVVCDLELIRNTLGDAEYIKRGAV